MRTLLYDNFTALRRSDFCTPYSYFSKAFLEEAQIFLNTKGSPYEVFLAIVIKNFPGKKCDNLFEYTKKISETQRPKIFENFNVNYDYSLGCSESFSVMKSENFVTSTLPISHKYQGRWTLST